MPLSPQIFSEVNDLIALGKTEQAIVKLRKSLDDSQPGNSAALQQVLLLSGQYHSWEEDKLGGIKDDSNELARINKELLRLVDNLSNPDNQAQPYSPPITTSPDPLRPVYIPTSGPPQQAEKKGNNTMKYVSYFFIAMGVIFMLGILAALGDDDKPASLVPGTVVLQAPADATQNSATEFEPRVSQILASQVRNKMLQLVESGAPLNPTDFVHIDPANAQFHFGNTTWYAPNTGYVNFSPDGLSASYANGTASAQLVYYTVHGFYIAKFKESTPSDNGYLFLVPPGQDDVMTVYVESLEFSDVKKTQELQRR